MFFVTVTPPPPPSTFLKINSLNPTHFHNIITALRKCVFLPPKKNKSFNEQTLNFGQPPHKELWRLNIMGWVFGPEWKIPYLQATPFYSIFFCSFNFTIFLELLRVLETKHITFMENYSGNAVFEGFCLTRTLLKMDSGLA